MNFESESFDNISFDNLFNGIVLDRKEDKFLIYVEGLNVSSKKEDPMEYDENINNKNIINRKENIKSIKTLNGIWCKQFSTNSQSIKPEIGSKVTVFFFNGDPQLPFFFNNSIYNKPSQENIDVIYQSKEASLCFNKDKKEFILGVGSQKLIISEENIKKLGE
ncbi:hypothetical protein Bp8pS_051 [Bacillus phage vB_BpuM-BpSp]|nr:hypothetical protein Bp8pS_051 [Bacillus phage vB_BpuM-BpSp]